MNGAPDLPSPRWSTLRDLDQAANRVKGSAFLAFKRLRGEWREGRDFVVLDALAGDALVDRLRSADRLYQSSIHPVLLAPESARQVLRALATAVPTAGFR